ncbi:EF hand domain containing protein [Nitzschia inconspicua]|uniref:EF hand domain containing protein n=1 Tax=Nitzschia inconspicua TaxID=303405 RepID=A0A9K3PZ28_9STRA|nr:EF hand domain containing protein [Nitzschia inconspicua]
MRSATRSLLCFLFVVLLGLSLKPIVLAQEETAAQAADCGKDNGECINPDAAKSADVLVAEEDPNCPSRDNIIRCAGKHLDTNQNGKLDRTELESAIASLPWYARGILQILGSVDKMMKKCDVDGDDAISMDYDMHHNKDQCLASCFKRKAFKNSFFPDCQ